MSSKKRVSLNRGSSSLLLDYQSMLNPKKTEEPNEYTRQLVASALSLPPSTRITTTKVSSPPSITPQNKIDMPRLLKSSLRTPKSASAPCSPTAGLKSVHFNKAQLEEVCLFKKAQTPLAISQKNIFWADDEEETSSSSSSDDEEQDNATPERSLVYPNWPTRLTDIIDRKNKMIRVDKNMIRLDGDWILGQVSVRNLDYHKTVTIRYTFDFWETIDNIQAIFYEDHKMNDIFRFKIHVPSSASTLYFAIKYKVGSEEYWDNNDGRNYEIKIVTKPKQAKKIRKKKHIDEIPTVSKQQSMEDGLKARYDFGQSIHQAKSNTSTATNATTTTSKDIPQPQTTLAMPIPISPTARRPRSSSSSTNLSCHSPLESSPSFMDLNSQSYMDLVNKYCFYSTSPSRSPMPING